MKDFEQTTKEIRAKLEKLIREGNRHFSVLINFRMPKNGGPSVITYEVRVSERRVLDKF